MKVGADLYAPKKFGRTCMPSYFFSCDACALLLEVNGKEDLTDGTEQEKRRYCPCEWEWPFILARVPPAGREGRCRGACAPSCRASASGEGGQTPPSSPGAGTLLQLLLGATVGKVIFLIFISKYFYKNL